MTKEFFIKKKKWGYEGWVSLSFNDFGLGISTYNKKNLHNVQIDFLFLNFYLSAYKRIY